MEKIHLLSHSITFTFSIFLFYDIIWKTSAVKTLSCPSRMMYHFIIFRTVSNIQTLLKYEVPFYLDKSGFTLWKDNKF